MRGRGDLPGFFPRWNTGVGHAWKIQRSLLNCWLSWRLESGRSRPWFVVLQKEEMIAPHGVGPQGLPVIRPQLVVKLSMNYAELLPIRGDNANLLPRRRCRQASRMIRNNGRPSHHTADQVDSLESAVSSRHSAASGMPTGQVFCLSYGKMGRYPHRGVGVYNQVFDLARS